MHRRYAIPGLFHFVSLIILSGCNQHGKQPIGPESDPYEIPVPAHFPEPFYKSGNNPATKEGFELGRMLFYDSRLSRDGTIACGSCHRQSFAFADSLREFSIGINGQPGIRNTPGLFNMIFQREFFWDGGANHLEITPLNALTSPVEMDETLENVIQKLQALPVYRDKFKAAFGKDTINSQLFFRAIAQFTASLVSADSRYDQYVLRQKTVFSEDEKQGLALFQAKCASCHATNLFTDHSYRNNGLDADTALTDTGREIVTQNPADRGKFRVPSLRNVAVSAPYMHDGRFSTLMQVLDHYDSGVKDSPTLDSSLKLNGTFGIRLTSDEKDKLLQFLHTLTDTGFCSDSRFSNPLHTR